MKKKIFFILFCVSISIFSYAQQIPLNECGIVCTYDAAGNRLKRVYFCNNGTNPYPTRIGIGKGVVKEEKTTIEYQSINALYPNPTSGKFSISFSKELKNAKIYILDLNSKIIQQSTGNGYQLNFDLSTLAAGVYMVRIEDGESVITKKVIKQ